MNEPERTKDDVYALVFREVDAFWETLCSQPTSGWQYVLVEEWSNADGSQCAGRLLTAWVRDESGLNQINLLQYLRHRSKIRGRIYPFVVVSFHILPHLQRVVLGHREADTAGAGCRYTIEGTGNQAMLKYDPTGGGWRS
jgi:hypothetical protein